MGYEVKFTLLRDGRSDEEICQEWAAIISVRGPVHSATVHGDEVILRFKAQSPHELAA